MLARLEYIGSEEAAEFSEREFAGHFVRVAESLSVTQQRIVCEVRWIAVGSRENRVCADGVRRWRSFSVVLQVMRSGVRLERHFDLAVDGWRFQAQSVVGKNHGKFWISAVMQLCSGNPDEVCLFSAVRDRVLFARALERQRAGVGNTGSVPVCGDAGGKASSALEDRIQVELCTMHRSGILP